VIVTVVIEKYASDRLREHIAHDVLSAAYAKVIPPKIYTQVADNVFRCDVYRKKWEVRIKANAQKDDITTGIAILNVSYSYDLENLNERKISYDLSLAIDLDLPLRDKGIPNFKSIGIYEGDRLLVPETHATALLKRQQQSVDEKYAEYTESKLTFKRTPQEICFIAQVPIAARGSVTVRYVVERAIRIPGDYILNATVPADGIRIMLNVDGFQLGVVPLHPVPDVLKPLPPDTWLCEAGILPWQGFQFTAEV
jgi:hypothetical protein